MILKKICAARIILAMLIVANMVMIFMFSSETGEESGSRSDGVIDLIARIFVKDYDELPEAERSEIRSLMGRPVRKAAHMAEYASLAFLTAAFLLTYTDKPYIFLTVPICFAWVYALTDELIHQRMTEGRSGSFTDVLVDTAGAVIGTLVLMGVYLLLRRARKKRAEMNEK